MSTQTTSVEPIMNKKLGFIAMIISATGMGMVGFFSRGATLGIDPAVKQYMGSALAMGRMLTGLAGFVIILLVTKRLHAFRQSRLSFAVAMGGLCIGTSLAAYITSTLLTSIANAVFLIYTGPLFSAIMARIFRKERISLRNGIFLFLVFVGMMATIDVIKYTDAATVAKAAADGKTLAEGWSFGLDLSAATAEFPLKALGDLFGLLSGLFYGLALFFYGYRKDMESDIRGTWNFFWAAIATGAITAVLRPEMGYLSGTNWMWAGGLFVMCGLIALGFLVVAGRNLPAVELSCVSYWECVVALFFGFFYFGESISLIAAFGGLLIIIGGAGPIIVDLVLKPGSGAKAQAAQRKLEEEKAEEIRQEVSGS